MQAAARSPAVAAKLIGRAFELTSADDPDREEVAAELAPLLLQTGRPKGAEQLAREVLARGPQLAHEVALRRALGEVLWAIGWLEPAVAELEAATRVVINCLSPAGPWRTHLTSVFRKLGITNRFSWPPR